MQTFGILGQSNADILGGTLFYTFGKRCIFAESILFSFPGYRAAKPRVLSRVIFCFLFYLGCWKYCWL